MEKSRSPQCFWPTGNQAKVNGRRGQTWSNIAAPGIKHIAAGALLQHKDCRRFFGTCGGCRRSLSLVASLLVCATWQVSSCYPEDTLRSARGKAPLQRELQDAHALLERHRLKACRI